MSQTNGHMPAGPYGGPGGPAYAAAPGPAGGAATAIPKSVLAWLIVNTIGIIALAVALIVLWPKVTDDASDASSEPAPAASATATVPAGDTTPDATVNPTQPPAPEPNQSAIDLIYEQQHRDPNDPFAKGEVDATIVIVEFADFRCGYCAQSALTVLPELQPLIDDGSIRIEWRDMPVLGDQSVDAAVAARAAAAQDYFWQYNTALFTQLGSDFAYDDEAFVALAEQVGVPDIEAFRAALDDPTIHNEVLQALSHGQSLGVNGTPSFIVGESFIPGYMPVEDMTALIDQEIAKAEQANP